MNTLFRHRQCWPRIASKLWSTSTSTCFRYYQLQTCDRRPVFQHKGAECTGRRLHCVPHRPVKQSIHSLCKDAPARHYSCSRAASSSTRTTPAPPYSAQDTPIAQGLSSSNTTLLRGSELDVSDMTLKHGEFVGSLDCGTT